MNAYIDAMEAIFHLDPISQKHAYRDSERLLDFALGIISELPLRVRLSPQESPWLTRLTKVLQSPALTAKANEFFRARGNLAYYRLDELRDLIDKKKP